MCFIETLIKLRKAEYPYICSIGKNQKSCKIKETYHKNLVTGRKVFRASKPDELIDLLVRKVPVVIHENRIISFFGLFV